MSKGKSGAPEKNQPFCLNVHSMSQKKEGKKKNQELIKKTII
jgi:hypothetical protein